MKSVAIAFAYGCPRSEVDTVRLFEYFRANGFEVTTIAAADLVLVSTCGVDTTSEDVSIEYLKAADARRKPGSRLVVLGCLAGINERRLQELFDAVLVDPAHFALLDDVIGARVELADIPDLNRVEPLILRARNEFAFMHEGDGAIKRGARKVFQDSGLRRVLTAAGMWPSERGPLEPGDEAYTIRVGGGCKGECSYCAIRVACGEFWSKPLDDVLREFHSGLDKGFTEFKIVAQDLGPYGEDIGCSIVDLLTALTAPAGQYRLTLLDMCPEWFCKNADGITDVLAANEQKIRLLMLPIQSGSTRMLTLMRRGYAAEDALDKVCRLRRRTARLPMATHVLVGFPGETEDDFEKTLQFLKETRFNRIDIYEYDDRPKTLARELPDKVAPVVRQERAARLKKEFPAAIR